MADSEKSVCWVQFVSRIGMGVLRQGAAQIWPITSNAVDFSAVSNRAGELGS